MIRLSVNVNKIATLRNSRGGKRPEVVGFALGAIEAGAHGITVHPRPDERHIRRSDVFDLREVVRAVEFNIEGYPDARYLEIIRESRPEQATLVPDPPDALTSNAGWDAVGRLDQLRDVVDQLHESGTRVSIFLEPDDLAQVDAAREAGADRIELYTEPYARAFEQGCGPVSFETFARAARHATSIGLGVNSGHDLDLDNLALYRGLPGLLEVSIGHALVSDALWMGWRETVARYLQVLNGPGEPSPA